jgi:cellulose synthase/poly-beta-1,6-N-acetylglucosamine synthase-like glycosyltransferase
MARSGPSDRSGAGPVMSGLSWLPLGLIGILSWSVWLVRRTLSRHAYSEIVNDFRTTTSVVVPVYREDADVLERCLRSWLAEDPTEVILVVDDLDDLLLARLRRLALPRVRVLPWRHTGKRGALGAGVRAATGEIVVFADSDTSWRPGLLAALQRPFVDPRVGGVGSRQHVYLPQSDLRRRVAYWLLNTRYLDYVPAMSRAGGVACLSGRTAAYRRSVIMPLMPALEHEIFLGRECVAGDDGRLTWLVLAAGYRTVHQASAQADSMFPDSWAAFLKQRIRWSRNSYRCYLTAVAQGWLWRQPLITQVTVLQVLVTPLTMGAAVFYTLLWASSGGWATLALALGWAVVGRGVRSVSHLRDNPGELALLPLMAVVIAGIALPIKVWAAVTMNRQGWLTRTRAGRVQGQGEIETSAVAAASVTRTPSPEARCAT